MLDCVVKHVILMPGQWTLVDGIKIENTNDASRRVIITVVMANAA